MLLILPIAILPTEGVRRHDSKLLWMVVAAIVLLGPASGPMTVLAALLSVGTAPGFLGLLPGSGVMHAILLWPLLEGGTVGLLLVYLAALRVLGRQRAADPASRATLALPAVSSTGG